MHWESHLTAGHISMVLATALNSEWLYYHRCNRLE